MPLTLDTYRLLGRSGLRVSPLALGTATFGTEWGWGAEPDDVRKLFDTYVGRGGNFIDTAGTYTDGSSERLLGEFTRDNRESLVLATKCTTLSRPGRARSCTWRFPTFRRGWSAIVALQIEYSLVERTGERDLIPMARELGLGVVPYLPLASRVLTGKYRRDDGSGESTRRSFNADLGLVTERNLAIADVVQEVAAELECTPPRRSRSPGRCGTRVSRRRSSALGPPPCSPVTTSGRSPRGT
ncbi:aldo/keto reductase [Amycolatopsis methanolica]|uniref:Rhizopine catabolism protein n=1 Tax=Amycolatopsis methanolica 239 TaxID=1068978 RepID=A0A076N1E0_AMYME|nr:aldo/keto reductase [Amycolatopsis methanolica]AIJ26633.1 rhizopine catabolism protein [Amycolatopsis methanolica 239]